MKTRQSRHHSATVSHSRWLAYATATTATALAGSQSAEAAIHYSGPVDVKFTNDTSVLSYQSFPLDPSEDIALFRLASSSEGLAGFYVSAFLSGYFRGYQRSGFFYVSRLPLGEKISNGHFTHKSQIDYLIRPFGSFAQWKTHGQGFIGFRFGNFDGVRYGWARIKMEEGPLWHFKLVDYAYADPGEPIRAGQKSSGGEMVPDEGSLGWLALGAVGLLVWRRRRSRPAGSSSRYQ